MISVFSFENTFLAIFLRANVVQSQTKSIHRLYYIYNLYGIINNIIVNVSPTYFVFSFFVLQKYHNVICEINFELEL